MPWKPCTRAYVSDPEYTPEALNVPAYFCVMPWKPCIYAHASPLQTSSEAFAYRRVSFQPMQSKVSMTADLAVITDANSISIQ